MARKRRSVRRGITRALRRRQPRRNDLKKFAKKALMGTMAGMAVAVPISLLARHIGKPELIEVADRGGAVAATAMGGTAGQVGYQIADAMFDRFVVFNGQSISGGNQSYL